MYCNKIKKRYNPRISWFETEDHWVGLYRVKENKMGRSTMLLSNNKNASHEHLLKIFNSSLVQLWRRENEMPAWML